MSVVGFLKLLCNMVNTMKTIFYVAFFLICFNIGGLATTNILRLTSGNDMPILFSKCCCSNCGASISPILQLPIVSYIICKGRCRKCKAKIPILGLILEIIILFGMFLLEIVFEFSLIGITLSFIYYEIVRVLVILKDGKRENNFIKQYIIAVIAMLPYYIMTMFVSVLYGTVCYG